MKESGFLQPIIDNAVLLVSDYKAGDGTSQTFTELGITIHANTRYVMVIPNSDTSVRVAPGACTTANGKISEVGGIQFACQAGSAMEFLIDNGGYVSILQFGIY